MAIWEPGSRPLPCVPLKYNENLLGFKMLPQLCQGLREDFLTSNLSIPHVLELKPSKAPLSAGEPLGSHRLRRQTQRGPESEGVQQVWGQKEVTDIPPHLCFEV